MATRHFFAIRWVLFSLSISLSHSAPAVMISMRCLPHANILKIFLKLVLFTLIRRIDGMNNQIWNFAIPSIVLRCMLCASANAICTTCISGEFIQQNILSLNRSVCLNNLGPSLVIPVFLLAIVCCCWVNVSSIFHRKMTSHINRLSTAADKLKFRKSPKCHTNKQTGWGYSWCEKYELFIYSFVGQLPFRKLHIPGIKYIHIFSSLCWTIFLHCNHFKR